MGEKLVRRIGNYFAWLFERDIPGVQLLPVPRDIVEGVFQTCLNQCKTMNVDRPRPELTGELEVDKYVLVLVEKLIQTDIGARIVREVMKKARERDPDLPFCREKPKIAYEVLPYQRGARIDAYGGCTFTDGRSLRVRQDAPIQLSIQPKHEGYWVTLHRTPRNFQIERMPSNKSPHGV